MSGLIQELIVGACVLAAVIYALRRWVPRLLVARLQAIAALGLERFGQAGAAQRLRVQAESKAQAQSGCGSGCGSCGACDTPKAAPAAEQAVHFHRSH